MPSIHSIVSTLWVVRSQSTAGTRKSGSSRVFSAISDSAAASSRRSISIATERDIVLMTSISRSRRASAECARPCRATKKKSRGRGGSARAIGPEHLDGDRAARRRPAPISARCTWAIEAAATGGPNATNAFAQRRSSDCGDHGLGFGLRKRRQPVLQGLQVARHRDADHVGPRRQELAELDIGGAEPGQRARQPWPDLAPGRSISRASRSASCAGGGSRTWIDDAEHAFAREHEAGADEARDVGRRRSQTPARMQRHDAAAHALELHPREARRRGSSRRIRWAGGIGGSIRPGSDRPRHRRSRRGRAPGSR